MLGIVLRWRNALRTVLIIANADGTLAGHTVGPEAAQLDVGLGDGSVGVQQPRTEDGLREHVEDGVGDDLLVDIGDAGTVSNTPDDLEAVSQVSTFDGGPRPGRPNVRGRGAVMVQRYKG